MTGSTRLVVTGGAGYFGSVLTERARAQGHEVLVFDLNPPEDRSIDHVIGDVRDVDALRAAFAGADAVLHNVAQVPLAKDRALFWGVNVVGTANVLIAARDARVAKLVHTSSSAIYGIPDTNPVTETTPPMPLEAYGKAKLEAEFLCRDAVAAGLDVSTVRPRTVLGHGRLGIMAILFEFVADGAPVFVMGKGDNTYQFVHAEDLAEACLRAAARPGAATYNIGCRDFGTMRETLQALVDHADTGSHVVGLPSKPAQVAMKVLGQSSLVPFAPYHWLLYGESLWFDVSKAERELGWEPTHSNASAVIDSYEWFLRNRATLGGAGKSHHQSPAKLGLLKLVKRLPL